MSSSVDVLVERIGANDVSAVVVAICAAPGSTVNAGDAILEVETSKATYEVFAPAAGMFMHALNVGDHVPFGVSIGQIVQDVDARPSEPSSPRPVNKARAGRQPRFSRDAAELAARHGIRPEEFSVDFITTADVKRHISEDAALRDSQEQIPSMKQEEIAIVARGAGSSMLSFVGVTLGMARAVRAGAGFFENKITDLVAYEASRLMRRFKKLNAAFFSNRIDYHNNITAGIAFDGGAGLVVYGLRDSDQLSLEAIQEEIVTGFRKYARNDLRPRDVARATFTITDLSGAGVEFMLPLLPAGQSCIIGITSSGNSGYTICAGFDHRVTEGLYAARFLQTLREAVLVHLTAVGAKAPACAFCSVDLTTATQTFRDKGLLRLTDSAGNEVLCCRRCFNEPERRTS